MSSDWSDSEQFSDPLMNYGSDPDPETPPHIVHFNQGFNAAESDMQEWLNPYEEGSEAHRWWNQGWLDCQEQLGQDGGKE